MSLVWVPENPGEELDRESGSIRSVAASGSFSMPLAGRLNWLLAARGATIFRQFYSSYITTMAATEGRVYHQCSPNCTRILVLALVEKATSASGSVSVTPSDGAGSTFTTNFTDTTATTRWGSPGWTLIAIPADLTKTGWQYHVVSWTDLAVREISVHELPRTVLDPSSDTAVGFRSGAFAGLEIERMITEASNAGLSDLLAAVASAKPATARHMGGVLFPDTYRWSVSSSGSYANLADSSLGTSGFGFLHRARQLRSGDTSVSYRVVFRARESGGAAADVRVRSNGTGDTASATSLGAAFAWVTPDAGDRLDVDCTADDTIYLEGQTNKAWNYSQCSSIQLVEYVP